MKKQGRQLNILNGLFLKNGKEQEQRASSRETSKSQVMLKNSEESSLSQKEVSNMIGRSAYSSGLKTHKQLLEKYLQHSEEYFKNLAEYKKGYRELNRNLENFD